MPFLFLAVTNQQKGLIRSFSLVLRQVENMLQSINDKFKGWVTWVIIIAVSGVFILTGISYFFYSSGVSAQSVAKVGDEEISQNYFNNLLREVASTGNVPNQDLQQATLKQAINQALLREDAKNSGIIVTSSAISDLIFNDPAFQDNGVFSQKKFDEIARLYGGADQIKALLARNALTSSLVTPIIASQFALPFEQSDLTSLLMQTRKLDYVEVKDHEFVSKVKPTQKQLETYFEANKSRFEVPRKLSISYVELNTQDFVSSIPPTDSEVDTYYQNNADSLMTPERRTGEIISFNKKATMKDEIVKKLQSGQPLTKEEQAQIKIQKLPTISLAEASSQSDFRLFNMSLSDPLTSLEDGRYLLLSEIDKPKPMSLSDAKPVIDRILLNRAAYEKFNELMTAINSIPFKTLVEKYHLKVKTTGLIADGQSIDGIDNAAAVDKALFKQNKNSGFILNSNTSGIIFQVDKAVAAHQPNFDEVSDQVKTAFVEKQAAVLAEAEARRLQQALNSGDKTIELSQKSYSRQQPSGDKAEIKAIFSAPLNHYEIVGDDGGYMVFAVNAVSSPANELPGQSVENLFSSLTVNEYLAALHDQISIEINPTFGNA
ncbi:MAG: SurA N-terminal domain-containing protein [Francisellaceae bacterium]